MEMKPGPICTDQLIREAPHRDGGPRPCLNVKSPQMNRMGPCGSLGRGLESYKVLLPLGVAHLKPLPHGESDVDVRPGRRPEAAKVSFMARVRNHAAGHNRSFAMARGKQTGKMICSSRAAPKPIKTNLGGSLHGGLRCTGVLCSQHVDSTRCVQMQPIPSGQIEGQPAQRLASQPRYGVGECRCQWGQAGFTHAGGRFGAGNDVHRDLRHVGDARHDEVAEVALLHNAILDHIARIPLKTVEILSDGLLTETSKIPAVPGAKASRPTVERRRVS